jgi:diguanylate cyclase (GGDEF)-like protein/PAS domain S-box-containing protein
MVARLVMTLAIGPTILLGAWLLASGPARAVPFEMSPIRLGVLAFRPVEQTAAQWAPTANYLESELHGRPVIVVPLTLDTIDQAVAGKQVDFLLTNPEQYVLLASRHRLAAVATLMPEFNGRPLSRFGGVIFVRAERNDIGKLQDLDGKKIAAVSERSFAGFLIQRWTLQQAGVDLMRYPDRLVFTGLPQDRVVQQVLGGQADAGFVRTGVLEALEREGKLRADELRVINQQPENRYPQFLSTELYPEWPLAVMPGVPDPVIKAVTMALFRLPANHPASRAGAYYGFAPPGDYASIEALLLRMHLHPDRLLYFGVGEVGRKYAPWLIVGAGLVLLAGLALLYRITAQNRRLSAALARAERLALRDDLLDSLSEGVYGVDGKGLCTFINPAALKTLGYSRDEVLGIDQHALFHHHYPDGRPYPASECPLHLTLGDGKSREVEETFYRKDGGAVPVRLGVRPVLQDGQVTGAVVAFRDISAQKAAEALIISMALHDVLTGLPNRRLLNDRLETARARAERAGDQVAVLFVDLDGFKAINDQFGHDAGDVVLIETARRLVGAVRAVDTVARMGGDEFVVVLADLPAASDVERVADKLVAIAVEPIADGARSHQVSVSIGIAIFPLHGRDGETLLRVADQGMYAAKTAGKNCWRWGGELPAAAGASDVPG